MLQVLFAVPLFGLIAILQSAIISRITLLQGKADLVLLMVIAWAIQPRVRARWQWAVIGGLIATLASAMPVGTLLVAYLLSVAIAIFMQHRLWKQPFLAMLASVFIGTVIVHIFSYVVVILESGLQSIFTVFNLLFLPSVLLNFLWTFPIYLVGRDLSDWLYPDELKV